MKTRRFKRLFTWLIGLSIILFMGSMAYYAYTLKMRSAQKRLIGLWISTRNGSAQAMPGPVHIPYLLDISDTGVAMVRLGDMAANHFKAIKTDQGSLTTNVWGSHLALDREDFLITWYEGDSLVVSSEQDTSFITFKRVKNKPLTIEPFSGSYVLSWPGGKTNIHLISDSLALGYDRPFPIRWQVFSYKGYSLFRIEEGSFWPALVMKQINSDSIQLINALQEDSTYSLTKLRGNLKRKELIGVWKHPNMLASMAPPPPPGTFEYENSQLSFDSDTAIFQIGHKTQIFAYSISSDGAYLYSIPNTSSRVLVYQIVEFDEENQLLILSSENGEITRWKRM